MKKADVSSFRRIASAIVTPILAGGVGGGLMWVLQGHSLSLIPQGMTYAELAAVMLAAASVLVGVFGALVAFLALWGYRSFRVIAKTASTETARKVARSEVQKEMREGVAGSVIDQKVMDAMEAARNGKYDAWREEMSKQRQELLELDESDNE